MVAGRLCLLLRVHKQMTVFQALAFWFARVGLGSWPGCERCVVSMTQQNVFIFMLREVQIKSTHVKATRNDDCHASSDIKELSRHVAGMLAVLLLAREMFSLYPMA